MNVRLFRWPVRLRVASRAGPLRTGTRWDEQLSQLVSLIAVEDSAFRLGDILRLDAALDMPFDVVRSCYLRLFGLGISDVHTRLCYARYLLLRGPTWDGEAQGILGRNRGGCAGSRLVGLPVPRSSPRLLRRAGLIAAAPPQPPPTPAPPQFVPGPLDGSRRGRTSQTISNVTRSHRRDDQDASSKAS